MGTYGLKDGVDIDEMIESSPQIDSYAPYCVPIDLPVDKEQLIDSYYQLFKSLGFDYNTFMQDEEQKSAMQMMLYLDFLKSGLTRNEFFESETFKFPKIDPKVKAVAWDMNINHMPQLTGDDRWASHRGQFEHIFSEGVDPRDYTELLDEVKNTYLGKIITDVFEFHQAKYNRKFLGRANFIWIGPKQGYNFHIDDVRTSIRYHVPIITNPDVLWLFKDPESGDTLKMNMPAGTAWEFFPVTVSHTVINTSDTPRCHLIITEVS